MVSSLVLSHLHTNRTCQRSFFPVGVTGVPYCFSQFCTINLHLTKTTFLLHK